MQKEVLGKAVGFIPVLGDFIELGFDVEEGIREAKENTEFVEANFNEIENALILSDFDCTSCKVTYNTNMLKGASTFAFTGQQTEEIMARVNKKLGTSYTMDDLMYSPNELWDVFSDEPKYEEAIANK
jgi:hypothetical protein